MTTIDPTTPTAAEPRQARPGPAAIIAGQKPAQLDAASFCDSVYALAGRQGITMADSIRALLAAKNVN
jgi:hypothetical protein